MFQLGSEIYVLLRQIEMQYNQEDTFTMKTFFLGNLVGVKKLLEFFLK